jgi:hypothetical protein
MIPATDGLFLLVSRKTMEKNLFRLAVAITSLLFVSVIILAVSMWRADHESLADRQRIKEEQGNSKRDRAANKQQIEALQMEIKRLKDIIVDNTEKIHSLEMGPAAP